MAIRNPYICHPENIKRGSRGMCKPCYKRYLYHKDVEKSRATFRARRHKTYGLSDKEFDQLKSRHNGLCGISGVEETPAKILRIEHDHKTGKVRGLVCSRCNTLIGYIENNPFLLPSVMRYLGKSLDVSYAEF